MNPKDLFTQRVIQRLDNGLDELPQHIQARLNQARDLALAAKTKTQSVSVGQGLFALTLQSARQRFVFFALAGLMGFMMLAAQYARIQDTTMEAADIEEIILSDDAPVQAYTDPGFSAVFRLGLLSPAPRP